MSSLRTSIYKFSCSLCTSLILVAIMLELGADIFNRITIHIQATGHSKSGMRYARHWQLRHGRPAIHSAIFRDAAALSMVPFPWFLAGFTPKRGSAGPRGQHGADARRRGRQRPGRTRPPGRPWRGPIRAPPADASAAPPPHVPPGATPLRALRSTRRAPARPGQAWRNPARPRRLIGGQNLPAGGQLRRPGRTCRGSPTARVDSDTGPGRNFGPR
jgi:hypothetical protein